MFQVHSFHQSALDANKCIVCRHTVDNHKCEVCGLDASVGLKYGTILMCPKCSDDEDRKLAETMRPENVTARLNELEQRNQEKLSIIDKSKEIDNSIQVRTDLFNAATVSIVELKQTIDSDSDIVNKPFALAERLIDRFNHFKQVIFEASESIVKAGNEQKAIQVYLNQLANQLREEEREKLKISDINYKPKQVKPAKPAPIKTASKKLDKVALRKYAAELGISEFTIQSFVVSNGITVEEAARLIRKSINEAKASQGS